MMKALERRLIWKENPGFIRPNFSSAASVPLPVNKNPTVALHLSFWLKKIKSRACPVMTQQPPPVQLRSASSALCFQRTQQSTQEARGRESVGRTAPPKTL